LHKNILVEIFPKTFEEQKFLSIDMKFLRIIEEVYLVINSLCKNSTCPDMKSLYTFDKFNQYQKDQFFSQPTYDINF